jgi:hypothetical protein
MRRRGTGRFGLATAVVACLGQVVLPHTIRVGSTYGALGITGALVVAGFTLAVVFTAMYDGPRDIFRLLPRHRALTRKSATSTR